MNFKEIFDREIIVEGHVRKGLKIFYEIDLNLIKPKQEQPEQQPPAAPVPAPTPTPVPADTQTPAPEAAPAPAPDNSQSAPEQPTPEQQPESGQSEKPDVSGLLSSVQTEEENAASEDSEEKIMRHFKGDYTCKEQEADNIQTFDDIINILGKTKKGGVNILDDFCKEITTLCANQNYNEIKTKLDKKSKIFVEIYFGYKKDDSVGVRFRKSENSDSLSSVILINNQIVPMTKFNIEKVNQKIVEYRNYEVNKS